jgi:hypothetical protein
MSLGYHDYKTMITLSVQAVWQDDTSWSVGPERTCKGFKCKLDGSEKLVVVLHAFVMYMLQEM